MTDFCREKSKKRWLEDEALISCENASDALVVATLVAGDRVLCALSALEERSLSVSARCDGLDAPAKLERLGTALESLAERFFN